MHYEFTIKYLREFIVQYMAIARSLKEKGTLPSTLLSFEGIYVITITAFGVIFALLGTRTRKLSIGSLAIFLMYSGLKMFKNVFDVVASPIDSGIRKILPEVIQEVCGNPERNFFGYLILAIIFVIILTFLIFWVKIAGTILLILIVYRFYKSHIRVAENTSSQVIEFLVIAGITIVAVYLVSWLEEFAIRLILSFVGCSVIIGFCWAFFDLPPNFYTFYSTLFDTGKFKDTIVTPDFVYLGLLTAVCMIFQNSVSKKQ